MSKEKEGFAHHQVVVQKSTSTCKKTQKIGATGIAKYSEYVRIWRFATQQPISTFAQI
jgi:hypothetical protein